MLFDSRKRPPPTFVSLPAYMSALAPWVKLGSFSNDDGDGNENVKKAIGLSRKTTTLHVHHAYLYISLTVLSRLRCENA